VGRRKESLSPTPEIFGDRNGKEKIEILNMKKLKYI
jgi:hypothetical protein